MSDKEDNKMDVKKAYEAIARIIGARAGLNITVKSIEKVQKTDTA